MSIVRLCKLTTILNWLRFLWSITKFSSSHLVAEFQLYTMSSPFGQQRSSANEVAKCSTDNCDRVNRDPFPCSSYGSDTNANHSISVGLKWSAFKSNRSLLFGDTTEHPLLNSLLNPLLNRPINSPTSIAYKSCPQTIETGENIHQIGQASPSKLKSPNKNPARLVDGCNAIDNMASQIQLAPVVAGEFELLLDHF